METPEHYKHLQPEPINVIEQWGLNFSLGCTIKYISRHRYKGDPVGDLKKAMWYIGREIDRLERTSNDTT